MTRYAFIDLSALTPPPEVLQTLSFEAVFQQLKDGFAADWEIERQAKPQLPPFTALNLASDPINKLLRRHAYAVLQLIQRVNDAYLQSRLAWATGAALDAIAAEYGCERLVLDIGDAAATPPVPETLESDRDLRLRAQLAWEAQSTAGPRGAYEFHARSTPTDDLDDEVADVAVFGPESLLVDPGQVLVAILSSAADGVASADLLAAVADHLTDEDRRPLTDEVLVESAEILEYEIELQITVGLGADAELVRQRAEDACIAYAADARRIAGDIRRGRIFAAAYVGDDAGRSPVLNATIAQPAADIVATGLQAPVCTSVTVTVVTA